MYTAVFLLGGCINNQNLADESGKTTANTSSCTIPENAFKQLPVEVLSGTDVVDINGFQTEHLVHIGRFKAEMGGAIIEINIPTAKQAHRTYKEPETKDSSKTYTNLCIKSGYVYGQDIRGIFTKKGLLWLELQSGHEFITSDLWIHLNNAD